MKIAILIPCYNEEKTIANVINSFKKELPNALIYVYDNNSSDQTYRIAKEHGAIVKREFRQGKGNVIRSMFRNIDADIYVMIDGDDTYPAEFVHSMIAPIINNEADMVIGDRHSNGTYAIENKRIFHNIGNKLVARLINGLFGSTYHDIMTGYRVFNKRFAKNLPIISNGFEIETEMTLHALDKKFLVKEIPISYRDRPEGSFSKLNTYKDGIKVLNTIFRVLKDYKPLLFFVNLGFLFFLLGLVIGFPVVTEFIRDRYITRVPSAILAAGFEVLSTISFTCGFILDTITRQHKANYELLLNQFETNANVGRREGI